MSYSSSAEPTLTDTLSLSQLGQVYCTTTHDLEGLECSVIMLAGIGRRLTQEKHDLNSLLYVGCSRARHHLIVLMPENADHRVNKALAAATLATKT